MVAGDLDGLSGSIANGATINIRPGSAGVQWMLKKISCTGAWELYTYDGTTQSLEGKWPDRKSLSNRQIPVTYDKYYLMKNVSGSSQTYDYRYGVHK